LRQLGAIIVDVAQLPLAAAHVRHVRQAIDGLAHRLLNVLGLGEAAQRGLKGTGAFSAFRAARWALAMPWRSVAGTP